MGGELGTVDNPFEDDVRTGEIGRRGNSGFILSSNNVDSRAMENILHRVSMVQDIDRTSIHHSGVGTKSIESVPFVPHSLEHGSLRSVTRNIGLEEVGIGAQFTGGSLAILDIDVHAGDVPPALYKVTRKRIPHAGLESH